MEKMTTCTLLAKIAAHLYVLLLAGSISAQSFTLLHDFTAGSGGSSPYDGLVLYGHTLYGTTYIGASDNGSALVRGTVFAMNTDGTGFTNLHSFPQYNDANNNPDGNGPIAGLIASGCRLYGTSVLGGKWGDGTVFALNTDGTGFTVLHDFNDSNDGSQVQGRLVLSGDILYGAATGGGTNGNGTVFALNTNGTGFRVLHSFTGGNEGASPYGTLTLSRNTVYGTAAGSPLVSGTVFSLNADGTGFKVLHTFPSNISDGDSPLAGVVLFGTKLYGLAAYGGTGGSGTVFAMNTDGTGFTNLHNFTAMPRQSPQGPSLPATNSDGAFPRGELILSNDTLYGSAARGGIGGNGTVFAMRTDGAGFTVLHTFKGSSDGRGPNGHLVLSGNTLYGTALDGGSSRSGSVFGISLSPQPTIIISGSHFIVTWPTSYAGFDYTGYALQSTTNLDSPVWSPNSPSPVVVNGQNTVTSPIFGTQQFFRLSQ